MYLFSVKTLIFFSALYFVDADYVLPITWEGPFYQSWLDDVCIILGSHYSQYTPEECQQICTDTPGCSAVDYSSNTCIPRRCPFPVPEPTRNYVYVGYRMSSNPNGYTGPTNYTFSKLECYHGGIVGTTDEYECMKACDNNSQCRGVVLGSQCTLVQCAYPVIPPSAVQSDGEVTYFNLAAFTDVNKTVHDEVPRIQATGVPGQ